MNKQTNRVYDAEDVVIERRHEDQLSDIEEVREWVKQIVGSGWYQARWQTEHIDVKPVKHRRSKAHGRSYTGDSLKGEIKLPKWAYHKMIVLHEIAHVVTSYESDDFLQTDYHSAEFCQNYLALVGKYIGIECQQELEKQFKLHYVRHTIVDERRNA